MQVCPKCHNPCFDTPWRLDSPFDKFKTYCTVEELEVWNPKLVCLILRYKECFDDDFWYYLSKRGKYIRRVPLWMTGKRMAAEKPKPFSRNHLFQKKLFDVERERAKTKKA